MNLSPAQRQTLLWGGVAVLLVWALIALGPVLTPFVAATILAYALEPAVAWLSGRRVPRLLAVVLVMALALLAIVAIVLVLVPILQHEFVQVRARLPALFTAVTERLIPWLRQTLDIEVALDVGAIRAWLATHLADSGEDLAATLFSYARSGWGAAMQVIGLVFLVPVVLFYLLLDWPSAIERARELVPPRWRSASFDLLGEIDALLGQYLRGQLLVMLALAVYYSLALALAGFKLWLPIGVLTGLLILIPYLGFALGLIFALVSGMLQLGPLAGLVSVAIVYGVGQLAESLYLTPRLVGERIGLHPVVVILALLAFGALFGFVGVLLALPLSAVVSVALRRLRRAYLASDFYGRDAG
ncbi:MAG TPA: AI-2E family transporter [Burkholderiaceae bacterium]